MVNFICIGILMLIVGSACLYIWKEKKRGHKCIGCSMAANGVCPRSCSCKSDI